MRRFPAAEFAAADGRRLPLVDRRPPTWSARRPASHGVGRRRAATSSSSALRAGSEKLKKPEAKRGISGASERRSGGLDRPDDANCA